MTTVIIDGGRSYDIDPAGRTADAVASEVAAAVLEVAAGQTFGLKVDGIVLRPSDTVAAGDVIELVDISDYTWSEAAPVALAETGSIAETSARRGRGSSDSTDDDPADG